MVTVGDKIIVVFGLCNRVIHKFCYDVELIFCSFLSKFTYLKNLKTGTIHLKAAKCEIQKPSTCCATLFRCKFSSMFPVFHLAWSTCRATKTFVAGWGKLLRKVERGARVYFEPQILALLLVFHQIHNLSRNKFARALANQPINASHFFNLQQMFLFWIKLITQGEKRETSTKTCNETMLRDKLKVFVSRISPPFRVDLHGTTLSHATSLRQAYDMNSVRVNHTTTRFDCCVRPKKCRRILKHVLKRFDNRIVAEINWKLLI